MGPFRVTCRLPLIVRTPKALLVSGQAIHGSACPCVVLNCYITAARLWCWHNDHYRPPGPPCPAAQLSTIQSASPVYNLGLYLWLPPAARSTREPRDAASAKGGLKKEGGGSWRRIGCRSIRFEARDPTLPQRPPSPVTLVMRRDRCSCLARIVPVQ